MEFQPGTSLAPASNERVAWFEKTYRIILPIEYVEVLRVGNGAVPLSPIFDQNGKKRLIERMLCLLDNPRDDQKNGWADITVVMTQLDSRLIDNEDLIGMNVIPFAALFGGDFLCLDYRANPRSPVIAVWEHENSDDFRPCLETVATSFTQFYDLLAKCQ